MSLIENNSPWVAPPAHETNLAHDAKLAHQTKLAHDAPHEFFAESVLRQEQRISEIMF